MTPNTLTKFGWWTLVITTVFTALSAVGGGIGMLLTDGLGMPASSLDGSPFTNFFWPSMVLLVIVGGTQTLASVLLIAKRPSALFWTAVAGFGVVIWIIVETAIIRGFSFLQALYATTGLAQLALVMALLGIVSWFPALKR